MDHIDFVGIAALLTAIVNSALLVYATLRGDKRDKKLAEVHDLVNGQSKKLEALSFQAGVVKGGDDERAVPTEKK